MSAAIELADRRRRGEADCQLSDLLDVAESAEDYQHALIHAGAAAAVDPETAEESVTCQVCGVIVRP